MILLECNTYDFVCNFCVDFGASLTISESDIAADSQLRLLEVCSLSVNFEAITA